VTKQSHIPAVLLAAAALVAGCGSHKEGKPIPSARAAELQKQLDSIENRFDFGDGACADIENNNLPTVRQQLAQIPSSVGRDTRNALRDSFDRLFELTSSQCNQQKGQRTTPTETQTETTPTETTPTETQTETTPTETTPQKPKKEKKPKGGGKQGPTGGDQGGDGGGGGGAGAPQGD
jgi:outer membrane biosynthesis protein TonB